jgi:hypothetical protein
MAERANELASDGFAVRNVIKDGNHFYVLAEKYIYGDEEEILSEADQLWKELDSALKRLVVLEEALEVKVKKDSIDSPPKVSEEAPAGE